jgi:hypothetical protein
VVAVSSTQLKVQLPTRPAVAAVLLRRLAAMALLEAVVVEAVVAAVVGHSKPSCSTA